MCTSQDKREALRLEMKQRRLSLGEYHKKAEALNAAKRLMQHPFWDSARELALYYPIKGELDTSYAANAAKNCGKKLLYPRCEGEQMHFFEVSEPSELIKGAFGIPEPAGDVPFEELSRTLVLVPALAVGRDNARLGWGGGYYDRFFAKHSVGFKLGFVYGFQLVDSVFPQSWDVLLDGILPFLKKR